MQDQITLPRTDTELDALITATASAEIRRASRSLLRTLVDEIDLRNASGNQRGGYFLVLEAVMNGIDPAELPSHFEREAAASRQRVQTALAALDEADARLKARRSILCARDGQLSALLSAIELAKNESVRAVQMQEYEIDVPTKTNNLVTAALEAGIDPAGLLALRPPRLDKEVESLKRYTLDLAVDPIRAVLNDPLRRIEKLPEWVRNILAKMGDYPGIGDFARTRYLEEVVTMLKGAVKQCARDAGGNVTGTLPR